MKEMFICLVLFAIPVIVNSRNIFFTPNLQLPKSSLQLWSSHVHLMQTIAYLSQGALWAVMVSFDFKPRMAGLSVNIAKAWSIKGFIVCH